MYTIRAKENHDHFDQFYLDAPYHYVKVLVYGPGEAFPSELACVDEEGNSYTLIDKHKRPDSWAFHFLARRLSGLRTPTLKITITTSSPETRAKYFIHSSDTDIMKLDQSYQ